MSSTPVAYGVNKRGSMTTDPIRNFRFLVQFLPHTPPTAGGWTPNSVTVGFTSVSGLSISTESIPYREGHFNTTVHQVPGQSTFSPVTLQRGVVLGTRQHWDWMRMLFAVNGGANLSAKQSFRADVDIRVLAHPVPYASVGTTAGTNYGVGSDAATAADEDKVAARFRLYNCWPTSVAYSDLNAGDNALMVEQMTLVHEGFDMRWGSTGADGEIVTAPSF